MCAHPSFFCVHAREEKWEWERRRGGGGGWWKWKGAETSGCIDLICRGLHDGEASLLTITKLFSDRTPPSNFYPPPPPRHLIYIWSLNTSETALAIWLSFKSLSSVSHSGIGHSPHAGSETRQRRRRREGKEECITNEINWLRGEINWFAARNEDLVFNLAWSLRVWALAAEREMKI